MYRTHRGIAPNNAGVKDIICSRARNSAQLLFGIESHGTVHLAFVVASQEAKDFDKSLFNAVANYLTLRVNESDAKLMAKIFAPSDKVTLYADRIKQTDKFKAWFYAEGMRVPVPVALGKRNEQV